MLEVSVREMSRNLGSRASGARLAIVADIESESGPCVFAENEGLSLVLSPVASCWMVVVCAEYTETEVPGVRDINAAIETK